ncbi:MAG: 16S rRNA (cytidine(1402)-2'-O)-methyltransferase [Burkholderiaceae bacterium]
MAETSLDRRTPGSSFGALYVVATPIGNLSDLGQRAADTLRKVRWVAAEDTRVSRVLLDRIGATARLLTVHQHNEHAAAATLIDRLRDGDDVALVTDAGTPAISDPGSQIVAAAHAQGLRVVPIPGACAPVTLLSAAGLPPSPFLFEGFLPPKDKARDERLHALRRHADAIGAHVLLFEAPHRIERTLAAIARSHGPARRLVVGRELTKKFEQIVRLDAGEALAWLEARPEHRRGEFVIAIAATARDGGGGGGGGNGNDGGAGTGSGTGSRGTGHDEGGDGSPTARPAGAVPPIGGQAPAAETAGTERDAGLESELVDWPAAARGLATPRALLQRLLRDLPTSRAVRLAEELTGQPHKALYALALSLKRDDN